MTTSFIAVTDRALAMLSSGRAELLALGVELVTPGVAHPSQAPLVCAADEVVEWRLSRSGTRALLAVCPPPMSRELIEPIRQVADGWVSAEATAAELTVRIEETDARARAANVGAVASSSLDPVMQLAAAGAEEPQLKRLELRLLRSHDEGLLSIVGRAGRVTEARARDFEELLAAREGRLPPRLLSGLGLPRELRDAFAWPLRTGPDRAVLVAAGSEPLHLAAAIRSLHALARRLEARPAAPSRAVRPQLLLVEDDPSIREALASYLEPTWQVLEAGTAAEAWRLAGAQGPDVVLADLGLPDGDGLTLVARLSAGARMGELPVLVLSGRDDRETRLRALRLGASDFLSKPCELEALQVRLDRALALSRRLRTLQVQAETDVLTGLANRRAFDARAAAEHARARRYATGLCVMALDLDRLKGINDRFGHPAGDAVLRQVARVLSSQLRAADFAARVGGDEFLVLLPHTAESDALPLAGRLHECLAREPHPGGGTLSCSIGLSALRPAEDVPMLLHRADDALLAAKQAGGGRTRRADRPAPLQETEVGLTTRSAGVSPTFVSVVTQPAAASPGVIE